MDTVNKTLYIPLYGKAYVSRRGILLKDPRAEAIWTAEGFPLRGKSRSKWLAFYMGMRAAVFDRWLEEKMAEDADAVILHLGCGLDSRVDRVGTRGHGWFDVDLPEVIRERRKFYAEGPDYQMISGDLRQEDWLTAIPAGNAILVLEGVSMYLTPGEMAALLGRISSHFGKARILMDVYSTFAAKASRIKNPINDVGVTQVYGLDDPRSLETPDVRFLGEHDMTPTKLVEELTGPEKGIFRSLYAGKAAQKLYRLYEYGSD